MNNFKNLSNDQITLINTIRSQWISDLKDASNNIKSHAGILHAFNRSNKALNTDYANVYDGFLDLIVYLSGALYKLDFKKLQNSEFYKELSKELKTVINRIAKWNTDRNLTNFDAKREFAYVLEETYELMFADHADSRSKSLEFVESAFLREYMEKEFHTTVDENGEEHTEIEYIPKIKEVELNEKTAYNLFSSLLESAIYCAEQISFYLNVSLPVYLNIVMDANDKKGKVTDAAGKIIKDKATFEEPESKF